MRTLLITGGAGFIGSHFIRHMLAEYPQYRIINIDNLSFAGELSNTKDFQDNVRYYFIQGDINDEPLLKELFAHYHIDGVIHFAAESHVDRSIEHPDPFIYSNIMGTYKLLCAANAAWKDKGSDDISWYRFHHISTDEVYGALGEQGTFTENSPYQPNSPYSASKASSDLLVRSFNKTYGLNAVITHCSNNFGPYQHAEKLIPTIIRKALHHEPIPIYGQGKQVRDWLYVVDHCRAIDTVFHQATDYTTVNIGADQEWSNIELAKKICNILDKLKPRNSKSYQELIAFVEDRPGHDFRYSIDSSQLKNRFAWQPQYNFEDALLLTVEWYLKLALHT